MSDKGASAVCKAFKDLVSSLNAPVRFQPIVQDGKIFIGTQDGQVICINTRNPELTGWPTWGRDAAHTGIVH